MNIKISDNYNAKYSIWSKENTVPSFPKAELPFTVSSKKFSSYADFNLWKKQLLIKIAEHGGVKWSR